MGIVALLITSSPSLVARSTGGAEGAPPPPAPVKNARKPSRTYDASGWPTYESTAAHLKRFLRERRHLHAASWSLIIECPPSDHTDHLLASPSSSSLATPAAFAALAALDAPGAAVAAVGPSAQAGPDHGGAPRWPLMPPHEFAKLLGTKSFSKKSDAAVCIELYRRQLSAQLGGLESLSLRGALAAPASIRAKESSMLGSCVRSMCHQLAELHLASTPGMGDSALIAFSEALMEGAQVSRRDPHPLHAKTS